MRDIAVRQESRASLTLHLLGQRFGVMAGAPAFDAERIPLGPRSLCRIMREASQSCSCRWSRDCCCIACSIAGSCAAYPQLLEMLNVAVAADGILPSLTFVPIRVPAHASAQAESARARRRRAPALSRAAAAPPRIARPYGMARPGRPRPHEADEGGRIRPAAAIAVRPARTDRQAAPGRRRTERAATGHRRRPQRARRHAARPRPRPAARATCSTSSRRCSRRCASSAGSGASLSREDNDTFELLGMLYTQIEREVRERHAAAAPCSTACRCRCCGWRCRTARSSCASSIRRASC